MKKTALIIAATLAGSLVSAFGEELDLVAGYHNKLLPFKRMACTTTAQDPSDTPVPSEPSEPPADPALPPNTPQAFGADIAVADGRGVLTCPHNKDTYSIAYSYHFKDSAGRTFIEKEVVYAYFYLPGETESLDGRYEGVQADGHLNLIKIPGKDMVTIGGKFALAKASDGRMLLLLGVNGGEGQKLGKIAFTVSKQE